MEQFLDHDNMQTDQDVTTAWERFVSLLVAFGTAVVVFFKSFWARGNYMPILFTPTNPAYFTARKRDPATIVTNLLTDEKREAQATGTAAQGQDELSAPPEEPAKGKEITVSNQRETETVSIRSFVESRCPTMKKGASSRPPRLMMIYFQGQVPHATSVSRRLRAYLVVKKVRICRL